MSSRWDEIREQLKAAQTRLEKIWSPDPAETRRILKERAARLAAPAEQPAHGETLHIAEFKLAHEMYGVETRFVREICPLVALTPLPSVPSFVLGLANVRGEIHSIVDLRVFFDLPSGGLTDLNKVVVLDDGSMRFGMVADAVAGVRRIAVADMQPSLPTLTGVRERYLKGVTPDRTVVIDAAKLMRDESLVVRQPPDGTLNGNRNRSERKEQL